MLVLRALLRGPQRYRLVDFGSGSGNLLLPLAALFPGCDFHAVEMKPNTVSVLLNRAAAAGLTSVTAEVTLSAPVPCCRRAVPLAPRRAMVKDTTMPLQRYEPFRSTYRSPWKSWRQVCLFTW